MPFGPYTDFKDCVGKNQDKDNPEGFCAFLHERVTGKFPTESAEEIQASASIFNANKEDLQQYTAALAGVKWFDEESGKKIVGVEIFRSGSHTDSVGRVRDWTKVQLTKLVANFKAGIPSISSIKLGHSSDEHTSKVAKELGLSPSILNGEGASGVGSAALGRVSDLHLRSDGTLIAEFDVPEKVAGMVTSRVFSNVSAEIIDDYQGKGPVLSGLALLGAERPALKELAGLGNVTIMDDGSKPDYIYTFSLQHEIKTSELDVKRFKEDVDALFKFQVESVYNVPVTEESLDSDGRVTNRKVVVQHIRASSISEARGTVLRTLERTLSAFGTVVGQGLGILTVAYASNRLAKFIVGNAKKQPSKPDDKDKRRGRPTIIDIVADRIYDEHQEYAANILIRGVITLGAFKLVNELWQFILAHKESNARQPVRVWAASQDEAQGVINDNFERKTWDSELVTTAIAAGLKSALSETVDDVQVYRFAGYDQGVDNLYLFDRINKRTRKPLKPHKHPHKPGQRQYLKGGRKGELLAAGIGAAAIISPGSFLGPAKVVVGKRGAVIRTGIGATLRGAKGVGKVSRKVANLIKKTKRKKRPALAARFLQERADELFEFITNNDVRVVSPIMRRKKRRKQYA